MDDDPEFVEVGGSAEFARFLRDFYATKGLAVPPGEEPPKPRKPRAAAKKSLPVLPSVVVSPPRTRARKSLAGPSVKALGKRPARESSPVGGAAADGAPEEGTSKGAAPSQRKKVRDVFLLSCRC